MFDSTKHLHFIGIGGSGISALAHLALEKGVQVSGSDAGENQTIQQLKESGATIFLGHQKDHLDPQTERVIYSEAIDQKTNPEYLKALELGIPVMSYFKALGELSKEKKTIVVTGTHGKTTTTAMLGQSLIELGLDPTVIVGSRVPYFKDRNLHIGESEWLVVEGCEYRENFSHLEPFGMVILNCEWEHVDYFKSDEAYLKAFKNLAKKLPNQGFLIVNGEDENCQKISEDTKAKVTRVAQQNIPLNVPGKFNQMNASHAAKVAEILGYQKDEILKTLSHFKGTHRRMELKGEKNGVLVIDDYAHHPTEINATLGALKEKYPEKRLVCVFQPHQYSRTHEFLEGFKTAFDEADKVIIPNIYEARDSEADKAKISAESLSDMIPHAQWGKGLENTQALLDNLAKKGDIVVTMGAGNVYLIGEHFLGL